MYNLISSGDNVFLPIDGSFENPLIEHDVNSKSAKLWQEMLEKEGLNPNSYNVDIKTLFELVRQAFEKKYNCKLNASFVSMYIASDNGEIAVKHDNSSRAFSTGKIVYIDRLLVNVLFEYIANYYLWSRFGDSVFPFCFPYALNLIDICCRQGYINTEENRFPLLDTLKEKCDARGYVFIANMYWSILAFIMCHELAHIYIDNNSSQLNTPLNNKQIEILADEYGYNVFLSLIDGHMPHLDSPFLEVFHDYLYAAPMVLFLFFEDLYYMEYWIYGEKIALREHPSFSDRIFHLLEISRLNDYSFSVDEGDDVLRCFWDISDLFREELIYKLKNGKLSQFIQKGYRNMKNTTGYEEALSFDNHLKNELIIYANSENINQTKLIGLYNIAVKFEVLDSDVADHGFVRSVDGKMVSQKPYNLKFRLSASLAAIIDMGVTLFTENNAMLTVVQLIKILITVIGESAVEISEEQAKVLIECHKLHADKFLIDEGTILQNAGTTHKTIDELCKLRCIELVDGKIRLIETIIIK